jgi:hypothetical protein
MHREHMLAKYFDKLGFNVYFVEKKNVYPWEASKWGTEYRTDRGINIVTCKGLPYLRGWLMSVYSLNDWILGNQLSDVFKKVG